MVTYSYRFHSLGILNTWSATLRMWTKMPSIEIVRLPRASNEFMALKAHGGVTFEAVILFSLREAALIALMNPAA